MSRGWSDWASGAFCVLLCMAAPLVPPICRWTPCGPDTSVRRVLVPQWLCAAALLLPTWIAWLYFVDTSLGHLTSALLGCAVAVVSAFGGIARYFGGRIDLQIRTARAATPWPPMRLLLWTGSRTQTVDAGSPMLADVSGHPEMELAEDVLARREVTSVLPCRDGRALLGIRSVYTPAGPASLVAQRQGSGQSLVDVPGSLVALTALDADERHFVALLYMNPNPPGAPPAARSDDRAASPSNIHDVARLIGAEPGTEVLDFLVLLRVAKRVLAAACAVSGVSRLLLFDAERLLRGRDAERLLRGPRPVCPVRPFASIDTDARDGAELRSVRLHALRDGRILCVHSRPTGAAATEEHSTVAIRLDIGDDWRAEVARADTCAQRASFTLVTDDMRVVHVADVYGGVVGAGLYYVDVSVSAPLPLAGTVPRSGFTTTRLPACDVRVIGGRLLAWREDRLLAIDIGADGALRPPRPFPIDLFRSPRKIRGHEMDVRVLSDAIVAIRLMSTLVVLDAEACSVVGIRHFADGAKLLLEPKLLSAAEGARAAHFLVSCVPVLPQPIAALVLAYLL